jgi:hypothetical protein
MVCEAGVIASGIVSKQAVPDDVGTQPTPCPGHKLTPPELRELSRVYAQASRDESDTNLKRALASASHALAQLGECIERRTKVE